MSSKRAMCCVVLFAAVCVPAAERPAAAAADQNFPAKPIRLVVPQAPGGANDLMARSVANYLTERLGRPVVVDNRAGADGIIGTEIVARSAPDGYTLLMVSAAYTTNAAVRKLPFDPHTAFDWVAMLGTGPTVLAVGPGLPVTSVKEVLAVAKAKPGEIIMASGGGFQHFGSALFKSLSGLDFTIVVYKGGALALLDVMGGRAHMTVGAMSVWLPHIRGGKVTALATGGAKRAAALPDLPTIAEAGVPGYDANSWFALACAAGTPPAIVARLNAEVAGYLKSPDTLKRFESIGAEVDIRTPEELRRMIPIDMAKWARIAREAGLQAE